jgi:hypothetical protein
MARKPAISRYPILLALAAIAVTGWSSPAIAGEEGLALRMAWMQTYLHKLDLSVQAGNRRLADLYLHELEEVAEETSETIESYEGAPVGKLLETLLLPAIEAAEARLEADPADREAVKALIETCNQCHQSTDHGEIRIVPATVNPYNQDFQPR